MTDEKRQRDTKTETGKGRSSGECVGLLKTLRVSTLGVLASSLFGVSWVFPRLEVPRLLRLLREDVNVASSVLSDEGNQL